MFDSELQDEWQPPTYNIRAGLAAPPLLSKTSLAPDPECKHNFARTLQWCSDGSSVMFQCENQSFQLFHAAFGGQDLIHALTLPQPAPIVDFLWYPGASQYNPPSYCFIASVRECPVKLLDGSNGKLRASYRIVDHCERQIAPHSLAFSLTTNKLYCGFQDAIEIFDVQRPGEGERLYMSFSKRDQMGLKGIVSALAFCPTGSYFAAGTLTPASCTATNIALYDESVRGGKQMLSVGGIHQRESCGVVQLAFNPAQGHMLYAAFRRSPRLWAWDLRSPSIPIYRLEQGAAERTEIFESELIAPQHDLTNQRIRFDIDHGGRWIATGDQAGNVAIYDIGTGSQSRDALDCREIAMLPTATKSISVIEPTLKFESHGDAVGAAAFRPLQSTLLTASGSRHFSREGSESESDDDFSDTSSDISIESDEEDTAHPLSSRRAYRRPPSRRQPAVQDSSIKLWNLGFIDLSH